MNIDINLLYILIEGGSNSPEIAFINRVISRLVYQGTLPNINHQIIEVGGSGNFNNIAKMIYRESILHTEIPVIAIIDKDFRTHEQVNIEGQRDNSWLIEQKNARKIYWQRHEWENFLLEETETIANILNRIPAETTPHKPYRRNRTNITKQQLDEWLLTYFKRNVINELIEYLRFNFIQKANKYLRLDKAQELHLPDVNPWFESQLNNQAEISRRNILDLSSLADDTLREDIWRLFTNDYDRLSLEQQQDFFQEAKIIFQGKEALKNLFNEASNYLLIQRLSYDDFRENLILPELERNINSLIIQELESMLFPYFNEAMNHQ